MCSSYKSQTTALNTIILQDIEANAKTQPLNALSLSLSLPLSTDMYFLQKFKVQRQNISNNGF